MRILAGIVASLIAVCCTIVLLAQQPLTLSSQSSAEAAQKSSGCVVSGCHVNTEPMHTSSAVHLGCTDCHGGNSQATDKMKAHVTPSDRDLFRTSANPVRAYTGWLRERAEFIRFVNPGDFRVVSETCGSSGCHEDISLRSRKSMMTHGGML